MTLPSADLRARILRATREAPAPTRRSLVRARLIAFALSTLWVVATALALHARMPSGAAFMLLATWIVAAALATAALAFGGRGAMGPPRGLLRGLPIAVGGVVIVAASLLAALAEGASGGADDLHAQCSAFTALVAAGPVAAALWVERRSDPVAPGATGAGLGAIAGAWACVAMGLACHRTAPLHIIGAHVGAYFLIVIGCALIGRRVLALR